MTQVKDILNLNGYGRICTGNLYSESTKLHHWLKSYGDLMNGKILPILEFHQEGSAIHMANHFFVLLSKEFSLVESPKPLFSCVPIPSCVMLGWLEDKKPEHNNGQIYQMGTVNINTTVSVSWPNNIFSRPGRSQGLLSVTD